MTAQAAVRRGVGVDVWVASARPFDTYHLATTPKTPCDIPTAGYGYVIPVTKALDDLCQPCAICFPAVLARTRAR